MILLLVASELGLRSPKELLGLVILVVVSKLTKDILVSSRLGILSCIKRLNKVKLHLRVHLVLKE